MTPDTINTADHCRQWRESMGWTQTYAATKLGVSRQYLCMVEAGKREPSKTLLLLMAALRETRHSGE